MNITSAIVYALPNAHEALRRHLPALPGVEIHAETPDGRFIITIEDSADAASVPDTVTALQGLEGVLSVAMVYQYCDDAEHRQEVEP